MRWCVTQTFVAICFSLSLSLSLSRLLCGLSNRVSYFVGVALRRIGNVTQTRGMGVKPDSMQAIVCHTFDGRVRVCVCTCVSKCVCTSLELEEGRRERGGLIFLATNCDKTVGFAFIYWSLSFVAHTKRMLPPRGLANRRLRNAALVSGKGWGGGGGEFEEVDKVEARVGQGIKLFLSLNQGSKSKEGLERGLRFADIIAF